MEFDYRPINPFQNDGLTDEDRLLVDVIRKTAYICGRGLDDIEYTVHQVLKQIGRTDLLPPCERKRGGRMTREEAIKKNPFDPKKGNESAYCRYLRYNVEGWYNLDSNEVLRRWRSEVEDENDD